MGDFKAGDSGVIGSVEWRIVQGKKSERDLRLDIRCVRFAPVKMTLGFLFADFYASNEETLAQDTYLAKTVRGRAGDRYIHFVKGAQVMGWEDAAEQLEYEREQRRSRALERV